MPTDDAEERARIIALAKMCSIHEPETRPSPWLIRACCLVVLRRFAGEDFDVEVQLNANLDAAHIVHVDRIDIGPKVWDALEAAGVPCDPWIRDMKAYCATLGGN